MNIPILGNVPIFSLIVCPLGIIALLIILIRDWIENREYEEQAEAKRRKERELQNRLDDLSSRYGKRLKMILGIFVENCGDTYFYTDSCGDDHQYKRYEDVDDDGTEYNMTKSEIHINGELVFKTDPKPEVLKEGPWIEDLLGIEDKMLKVQAIADEEQREQARKAKARAEQYARAEKLGEAACYIAENLGKRSQNRWDYSYHYEHGDFVIDVTREDRPKAYYNGTCVLHLICNDGDELQASYNTCEVYHEGATWEKQLFALEEDAKRQVKRRREEEQTLREEEYRRNHLPLKDL